MAEAAKTGATRGRVVSVALVVGCAAALLGPTPDPEALRARGVAALLREDAQRAERGQESLVGVLEAAGLVGRTALAVRVDGVAVPPEAPVAVAVAAALEPVLAGAGAAGGARVEIDVRQQGSQLFLGGRLDAGGRDRALPEPTPVWLPGRVSLLPPLLAIGAALWWRRVLPALFLGILAGSIAMAARGGAGAWAPLRGLVDVVAVYLLDELTDSFRIEIIGFIVALLAMVGVMSRAGGVAGLVARSRRLARGPRSAQATTFAAGLLVFFDDYANCMLVGSTLRPITDRVRISREKLAFIVDSTAAPVAGLSLLSTWIAFQVSIFAPQLPAVGIETPAYAVFVASLPYRAYCWLALFTVLAVALSGRDFGPMWRAERRARRSGALVRPGSRPPLSNALARMQPAAGVTPAAWRALVPLAATLVATALGIFVAGGGLALLADAEAWRDPERWRSVLLEGSGAGPIFYGAIAGWAVAVLAASLSRPRLPTRELARASAASAPTLGFASALLFQAWMIGAVCADLGTADYLVALLADALRPALLPVLLFVVAGLVAFATGSSWSTMSILLPNAVPLAAALGDASELGSTGMVVVVIGAVLDGAIFGDHCSPISDTTVLSSVAAGCDHLDHVRTQAPYAACTASVAVCAGYLPPLLGLPWGPGAGLVAGALGILAILAALGRPPGSPPPPGACPEPELP